MQTLATPPVIQMEPVRHRGEARIALRFPYDQAVIRVVRALPDARWSATLKCWHEVGTDIRYIQEALGHESIRTTEVYTHVAKDRKPASP